MWRGRARTARRWFVTGCITRSEGRATRMERRRPDPACNPYLALGALLQGRAGESSTAVSCRSRWRPTTNASRQTSGAGVATQQVPETLGEAIELTAESELVLPTLGERMFNRDIAQHRLHRVHKRFKGRRKSAQLRRSPPRETSLGSCGPSELP